MVMPGPVKLVKIPAVEMQFWITVWKEMPLYNIYLVSYLKNM